MCLRKPRALAKRPPPPHLPVGPSCASGSACCLRIICLAHGRGRGRVALQRVAHAVAVDVLRPQTGAVCVLLTRRVEEVTSKAAAGLIAATPTPSWPPSSCGSLCQRCMLWTKHSPLVVTRVRNCLLSHAGTVWSVQNKPGRRPFKNSWVGTQRRTHVATPTHCRRWQVAAAGPLIPLLAAAPVPP